MYIRLIQGEFSSADALHIIEKMIEVKIKFHENAILKNSTEEDIKYRESKIKYLQTQLSELKSNLLSTKEKISIDASISLT